MPIAKKSSFPSGEAKNRNQKLLPFNERLNPVRFRADAIRPCKGVPQIAAHQQHLPVKTNNFFFSFFPIL